MCCCGDALRHLNHGGVAERCTVEHGKYLISTTSDTNAIACHEFFNRLCF